jgi:serine/threonine protein kinase
MNYYPVGDLYAFVEAEVFSEALAKTYFKELLDAVSKCHNMSIYHRDIKLENLLLDEDYSLRLADFGLALNVSYSKLGHPVDPLVSGLVGSQYYMRPEIVCHGFETRKISCICSRPMGPGNSLFCNARWKM